MPAEKPIGRTAIADGQLRQLRKLYALVVAQNPFYQKKLCELNLAPNQLELDQFRTRLPFTTKAEVQADQQAFPPYGTNLTFPQHTYTRCHQTTGTTGAPLRWLDTIESWASILDNWTAIYHAASITAEDRLLFAFSFGPFLGFWSAFEAALRLGCFCFPAGGLSSAGRVQALNDHAITALCCTPTYALRLAEVTHAEGLKLPSIKTLVVAGEPGGSIPATRKRLETEWRGARVFDHYGMTEVGPVTFECPAQPGNMHVVESAYIAECVTPDGAPAPPGEIGELVLTTLTRLGSPLIRYRTGDLVRFAIPSQKPCSCGRHEVLLEGGILGRTDDMIIVRGVNIYPTAIEQILRSFPEIAEFQIKVNPTGPLTELSLSIEPVAGTSDTAELPKKVQAAFQSRFALRVPVQLVAPGVLPRFEMKARRWGK